MAGPTTTHPKSPATLRLTAAVNAEVREIAQREDASVATILRRLVKRGLEVERRALQESAR